MNCPQCFGVGFIKIWKHIVIDFTGLDSEGKTFGRRDFVDIWRPCPYEGCHNVITYCCDGENVDLAPSYGPPRHDTYGLPTKIISKEPN